MTQQRAIKRNIESRLQRIAIYIRVSTAEQAEKGYSLDTQLAECRAKAAALGVVVHDDDVYIDDGYSAAFLERPALDRLRDAIRSGRYRDGGVIMFDPDRLARNLSQQLLIADEIDKGGAELIFVSVTFEDSPEGKLFFSIRGAISDFEKEKIKERTARGKRGKALKGKVIYNDKPLGYDWDKEAQNYTVNDDEAVIIRQIYDMCAKKLMGTRSIAQALNAQGYRTKKGNMFAMPAVYRILKNPMYKGVKLSGRYYDRPVGQKRYKRELRDPAECIEIPVPAIVTVDTWDKAQLALKDNTTFADRNKKQTYTLSGIVRCGYCGKSVIGMNYQRHGHKYRYYICRAKFNDSKSCSNHYIPMDKLDDEVWSDLTAAAKSGVQFDGFVKPDDNADLRQRMEVAVSKLIARQAAMMKWVREGTVDVAVADKELQAIKKEIDLANTTIRNIPVSKPRHSPKPSEIMKAETPIQKRNLLRRWGIKVYVTRDAAKNIKWRWGF
jgi:site-specific DNA recombinase